MSSYINIEALALNTLHGYAGPLTDDPADIRPLDAEKFAKSFLRLRFAYGHLSKTGDILALTTFTDTDVALEWAEGYPRKEIVRVPKDTILLDDRLRQPFRWPGWELARWRYTVIHECAHQILFRMEPSERRQAMRRQFANRACTLRELSSAEGLEEWRANRLTSALLMPPKYMDLLMRRYARGQKLIAYGNRFNLPDSLALTHICGRLGVSRTTVVIRLRQLGHLVDRPSYMYTDPAEVSCDA